VDAIKAWKGPFSELAQRMCRPRVLQEVMGAITPEELEEYKTFTLAEVD
jgi:hypothetical protein